MKRRKRRAPASSACWDGCDSRVRRPRCTGKMWGATPSGSGFTARLLTDTTMQITTFGEDVNGELYVADYSTGTIYQVTDAEPGPSRHRAVRH